MEPRIGFEPTTYALRVRGRGFPSNPGQSQKALYINVFLPFASGSFLRLPRRIRPSGDQLVITVIEKGPGHLSITRPDSFIDVLVVSNQIVVKAFQ